METMSTSGSLMEWSLPEEIAKLLAPLASFCQECMPKLQHQVGSEAVGDRGGAEKASPCSPSPSSTGPPSSKNSGNLTWPWKITIFNGKINYKWAIFNSYVSLPEGEWCLRLSLLLQLQTPSETFFWIWSKLGSKKHLLIEYFGELGLLKHEHGMLAIPDTRIAEKTDEDVNDYHCPEPRS